MTSHGRWQAGLALLASLWAPAPAAFSVNSGKVEYYHRDALGNVRVVTDESGQVIERHDYLPFGEECTTGACATNPGVGTGQPLKFTSKERDAETGLDYFGARYYGQRVGRFTTIDPVYTWRENLADPQRWNRYAYTRNNPLRFVDPDGKAARELTAAQVAQFQQRAAAAGPSHDGFALGTLLPATGLALTLGPFAALAAEVAPAALATAMTFAASPRGQEIAAGVAEGISGAAPGSLSMGASIGAQGVRASAPVGRLGSALEVTPGTNAPATIGGRLYTGHALDRMQGRGLTPAVVEDTIAGGAQTPGRAGATVHTTGQARVILNPNESVKTVYPQ